MNMNFKFKERKLDLVIVVLIIGLAFAHYLMPGQQVEFAIKKGMNGNQIARELKEQGIILSENWFKLVLKISGKAKDIKHGRHVLRKHMSSEQVVARIIKPGLPNNIRLVIPEGWRMEQTAERIEALELAKADDFLKIARERDLEGYLFPSTYLFEEDNTTAELIIDTMLNEFNNRIKPLMEQNELPNGLSDRDVLTLASIVEREAVISSEKPLIAAVYLNRLKKNMRLEADPTVQYALGYWKKRIWYKDLDVDSPYNTYRRRGIPPGPICSPGYDSVDAVVHPANFDALYFVADNQGRHIFNKNFSEHKQAIAKVKRETRNK
jgi:peptidoglycan lytic transglycosylase G